MGEVECMNLQSDAKLGQSWNFGWRSTSENSRNGNHGRPGTERGQQSPGRNMDIPNSPSHSPWATGRQGVSSRPASWFARQAKRGKSLGSRSRNATFACPWILARTTMNNRRHRLGLGAASTAPQSHKELKPGFASQGMPPSLRVIYPRPLTLPSPPSRRHAQTIFPSTDGGPRSVTRSPHGRMPSGWGFLDPGRWNLADERARSGASQQGKQCGSCLARCHCLGDQQV